MRRRRSDELPRYVNDAEPRPFRWRRRFWIYIGICLFVCWILYPRRANHGTGNALGTNWSNYAYSLYATDSATLCHAVLLFDALAKYGSKADRVLFYPQHWDTVIANSKDRDSQLLVMARDKYRVKLHPVKLLTVGGRTTGTLHRSTYFPCIVHLRARADSCALQMSGRARGISQSPSLWPFPSRTTIALSPSTRT